jgi:TM2 domain-containing membrane protein YozV
MSSNPTSAPKAPPTVPPTYSLLPALLSLVIPGLGQIYQGRIGKGVLFFVCIYTLFFYGMALGHWKNVYIPDTADVNNPLNLDRPLANLYNRPQYLGQFWVGIVAWPAIVQYRSPEQPHFLLKDFERTPPETELNELQTNGDKTWDLGWVYTVIAGVLNIMVIYDALTGPAFLVNANEAGVSKEPVKHAAAARG